MSVVLALKEHQELLQPPPLGQLEVMLRTALLPEHHRQPEHLLRTLLNEPANQAENVAVGVLTDAQ